MRAHRRTGAARSWARAAACVLGRGYCAFFLTLLATALAPVVLGWTGYVVQSGSMVPSFTVGDVVVANPFGPDETVPLGRVVVFHNPDRPSELRVHRVVHDLGHGRYRTAGDANADLDPAPITADDVVARARILVPLVGRPLIWAQRGDVLPLAAWALVTLLAGLASFRPRNRDDDEQHAGSRRRAGRRRALAATATLTVAAAGTLAITGGDAADAAFTARTASRASTWTVGTWPTHHYTDQVLADAPYLYYQLDEASGSSAADDSGNGRTGTYTSIGAYHQAGALANNPGYAVRLDGTSDRVVAGGAAVTNPQTFSLELWFRTTSTAGGKLIGFESSRASTSTLFDRHVFMRPDGRLVYGGWTALTTRTITSPQAYNNGSWHHLVLTARPASGQEQVATMYVDGQSVASGTTSRTSSYSGYWRVGYGSWAWLGLNYPLGADFSGSIDQVAVYPSELSAGRVAAHYAAR